MDTLGLITIGRQDAHLAAVAQSDARAPQARVYALLLETPLLVAAFSFVMFFFGLGAIPITTPNEGLYAQIAREMIERHDWIAPHINGVLYFEKPPLLYWLSAASMRLLGVTPLAARLPSALAGILTVGLVWWMGNRLYGKMAATYSALVMATSLGFVLMARQVMFDTLFTALITLGLVSFWIASAPTNSRSIESRSTASQSAERSPRRAHLIYITYAALALAVLTKGFGGFFLPALVVLAYAVWMRDWPRLRPLWNIGGIALFLIIAVPWHVAIAQRHHEWLWFYIINEHVLRFLGRRRPPDFHTGPIYTSLMAPLLLIFPWSVFLPAAIHHITTSWRQTANGQDAGDQVVERPQAHGSPSNRRTNLAFMLCWIGIPLLVFTVSRSTTFYYLLPVVPPFALLIGTLWHEVTNNWNKAESQRWLFIPTLMLCLVALDCWLSCGTHAQAKTVAGERCVIIFLGGSCLMVGFIVAVAALRRGRFAASFISLATATALTWVVLLLAWSHSAWVAAEPAMAATIASAPAADHAIVAMEKRLEEHSAFVFYLPRRLRPVLIVEGRAGGDLEFGSQFPQARRLFISRYDLARLARQRPLFYLTSNPPCYPVPAPLHPVQSQGRVMLWANSIASGIVRHPLSH